MKIMISCPHIEWNEVLNLKFIMQEMMTTLYFVGFFFSPLQKISFPVSTKKSKRCKSCNLVLDVPAHWIKHLSILFASKFCQDGTLN